jgi:hypothetical protein
MLVQAIDFRRKPIQILFIVIRLPLRSLGEGWTSIPDGSDSNTCAIGRTNYFKFLPVFA